MKFMKNEDAVSPVIGVILMVAITVILAAVIAAFVFGMAGNVQKTKVVAATVTQSGYVLQITYQGGSDDASLQYLKISNPSNVTATAGPWYTGASNGGDTGLNGATSVALTTTLPVSPLPANKPAVGAVYRLIDKGTAARDQVTVVGHFADGADQVILDTTV